MKYKVLPQGWMLLQTAGEGAAPLLPLPTLSVLGHSQAAEETFASLLLLKGWHFVFADREQRRERGRQDVLPPARGMNMLINSSPWEMDSSYQLTQTRRGRGLAKGGEGSLSLSQCG